MAVTVTHSKTLIAPDTGSEDKVYGEDYVAADSHTLNGLGTGVETALGTAVNTTGGFPTVGATLTSGRVALVGASGVLTDDAGLLFNTGTDVLTSGAIALGAGSASAVPTQLAGEANTGFYRYAANNWAWSFSGTPAIAFKNPGIQLFSSWLFMWGSGDPVGTSSDTSIGRVSANHINFGGASAGSGSLTSRSEINKAVTAFTDAVAKATLTFTVPNAAHSASFLIRIAGSLGAGGAIGANESTQTATYQVDITRTAGVNAVATISAVYPQAAAATVAGGQNIATTAALSAIAGAVGATNTFTVDATLTRAGAGATNHTAVVTASLLNANASGVTVA